MNHITIRDSKKRQYFFQLTTESLIEICVRCATDKHGCTAVVVYLYLLTRKNRNGECFPSVSTIAKDLSMTDRSVRRALSTLSERSLIETVAAAGRSNTYRIITPDRSARGADVPPLTEAPGVPLRFCHPTPSASVIGPLSEAPGDLISREVDSKKQIKKDLVGYSEEFLQFWEAYPPHRKIKQPAAWEAWQSITQATPREIISAIIEFASSDVGRGEFCPAPATWLTEARWNDDRRAWHRHQSKPRDSIRDDPELTRSRKMIRLRQHLKQYPDDVDAREQYEQISES